jgi:myo-inositol-1(or 4)-monophosphatase
VTAPPLPTGTTHENRWADELDFAVDLAHRAGAVLMERYERLERIDMKGARDVVTEVDHLSEALILEGIRATYPADAILAEESGSHAAVIVPAAGSAAASSAGGGDVASGAPAPNGRTWVIDPVDGTVNYANGIPFFCVSVALLGDGQPAVGVVHDPTRGETFAAARAGGATLNGTAIGASGKDLLADYVVSLSLGGRGVTRRAQAVRKAVRVPRSMGSAALALAYVANGRFDAFVQQGGLSAWDVAAAGLIAQEAGATVTDMAGDGWWDLGRAAKSIGLLAAPAPHHTTLLEMVRAA